MAKLENVKRGTVVTVVSTTGQSYAGVLAEIYTDAAGDKRAVIEAGDERTHLALELVASYTAVG